MKAKIVQTDSETGEKKDMKDNPIYGYRSSLNGLIESKMDVFMFLFCIFTTYATYTNSTDIKAPIFVGLASIWFLYRLIKHKEPPSMSTPDLASFERNEKVCPEHKPSKAELDAMARDEQEADAKKKDDQKNSFISQIIAFWIGVWLWLPKTIYSLWLKVYDSLFGPDKPCPAGGEPQPQSEPQPETPSAEMPSNDTQPPATSADEPIYHQAEAWQANDARVAAEKQANAQKLAMTQTPSVVPPIIPENTASESQEPAPAVTPQALEQQQPINEVKRGGSRKDELLRKIKNLTRSLKRRS